MGRVSKYRGVGEEEKSDSHAILTTCSSISHELRVVPDSMNCVQIEESNEMGTEVLPAVYNKGKQPLHPMPDEVVLPPTIEEDPKTPEDGDDEGMEDPPQQQAPQLRPLPSEGWPNSLLQGHPCTEA